MRPSLLASLLCLTGLVAPVAIAADSAADGAAGNGVTRSISLRELGYAEGMTLSGIAARQDLYFPLPAWVATGDLRLDARLTGVLADGQRAAVQVLLADRPRWTTALKPGSQEARLSLALPRADLRQGFAKATLGWGAQWTDNRCVDQRLPGGFVTLEPDSAVTYRIDPASIDNVRAAWSALGPRVSILVSRDGLTPAQFQAAAALAASLLREGRQVSIAPLPQAAAPDADADAGTGTIWLASRAEIEATGERLRQAAGPRGGGLYRLRDGGEGADVALLTTGGLPALALLDNIDGQKLRLLTAGWSALADTAGAAVRVAGRLPAARQDDDGIAFAALGLGEGVQELVDRAEWPLRLDYTQVPAGRRPAALEIELAPGSTIGDRPQLLHVFVNNTLLRSVTLPDGGAVRRLTVPLPDGLLGRSNAIRIVLQRQPGGGDCREAPLASPAQILPGSRVTLVPDGTAPADFFALGPAMADGATLLVTRAQLKEPVSALTLAARVAADLMPAGAPLAVMVTGEGEARPASPFIALPGAVVPGLSDLPVRLDGGAVSVQDRGGDTVLDITGARGLITAQLARAGTVPGLSLSTADGSIPALPERLALDRGNVAFADQTGLLMAFDTVRDRAVRIVVADDAGWADWLDRFRIVLVLGAWALVTLGAVGALRRWYRSRAPKV